MSVGHKYLWNCKEIKLVHPNGNQPWIFTGSTHAEAEAPILWPRDAKSWLIGKDPDAGHDWRQEEKGTAEDEMVGRHHQLDGHECEQTLGDGEGQGGLVCCSPWGLQRARHDWATEQQRKFINIYIKGLRTRTYWTLTSWTLQKVRARNKSWRKKGPLRQEENSRHSQQYQRVIFNSQCITVFIKLSYFYRLKKKVTV